MEVFVVAKWTISEPDEHGLSHVSNPALEWADRNPVGGAEWLYADNFTDTSDRSRRKPKRNFCVGLIKGVPSDLVDDLDSVSGVWVVPNGKLDEVLKQGEKNKIGDWLEGNTDAQRSLVDDADTLHDVLNSLFGVLKPERESV